MKPMTLVLFAGLLISGCVHRHVTVVSGREDAGAWAEEVPQAEPYDEADGAAYGDDGSTYAEEDPPFYEEDACEPAWDGHSWVEFSAHSHGPDCGHFFYRDCWNFYPENHIYVEVGYAPCGETGGFIYHGDPWARVWDGLAFLMLRGHIHGADCGHSYHDGCWNVFPQGHVYSERGHRDFCASPPRARHDRAEERHEASRDAGRGESRVGRAEPVVRGSRGEAGGSSRRAEAQGPAQRARVDAGGRGGQPGGAIQPRRAEQPQENRQSQLGQRPVKREVPERVERPVKREAPERVERPVKREAPERVERPEKREAPQRIERPEKREAPQRIERPEKREAPQRIEKPEKREAPQKKEQVERPKQPERREEPKKQEAPKQPERPKKR